MNKMVVNHLDKIFVTSDAATLLKEVEVQHPAAKMIALAAKMQESECGDMTNFVISFAGELLQQAENLLKTGLHPSDIVSGYARATKSAIKMIEGLSRYEVNDFRNVDQEYIRVCKILGGSLYDSEVYNGLLMNRGPVTNKLRVEKAKVAIFACPFVMDEGETKTNLLIKNAEDLLNFTKSEEDHMEKLVKGIVDTGVNVIVVGGSISELAVHYFEKYGLMVLKSVS